MSSRRDRWWSTARSCIRAYPKLKLDDELLHEALGAAAYTGMPRGSGNSRSTEDKALKQLPEYDQRDLDAVQQAIDYTRTLEDGELRMEQIRLAYWSRTHYTVDGAGKKVGWEQAQARRKHGEFVRMVIRFLHQ